MPEVTLNEKGCRGCTLCVDICPVDVFDFDNEKHYAFVKDSEDCIGCLSCHYDCPSQCIDVSDLKLIRPYHRIHENVTLINQFLQTKLKQRALSGGELDHAYFEVGILLVNFAGAISEILGRGHKTVGRRAGMVAAAHLPEMYEKNKLSELLDSMKKKFGSSFDFEYSISEEKAVDLSVHPCGLFRALHYLGEKPGESNICLLFHEYWAGLISTFTGKKYVYNVIKVGEECNLKMSPYGLI